MVKPSNYFGPDIDFEPVPQTLRTTDIPQAIPESVAAETVRAQVIDLGIQNAFEKKMAEILGAEFDAQADHTGTYSIMITLGELQELLEATSTNLCFGRKDNGSFSEEGSELFQAGTDIIRFSIPSLKVLNEPVQGGIKRHKQTGRIYLYVKSSKANMEKAMS